MLDINGVNPPTLFAPQASLLSRKTKTKFHKISQRFGMGNAWWRSVITVSHLLPSTYSANKELKQPSENVIQVWHEWCFKEYQNPMARLLVTTKSSMPSSTTFFIAHFSNFPRGTSPWSRRVLLSARRFLTKSKTAL
jgi:hypothetical protein